MAATVSAEPSFSIKDSCEGKETALFSLNDKQGGNIGEPGYFKHQVCATEVSSSTVSSSCSPESSPIISMFQRNDSHASIFDDYRYSVCTDGLDTSLNKTCDKPIVSLHSKTDSHVAEPGYFKYQLCAARDIPRTVSVEISTQAEKVFVDGEEADKNLYQPGELAYPYIVTNEALGIVSYGPVERIKYDSGSADSLKVTQGTGGSFLLPYTRGSFEKIEDDEQEVNSRTFLESAEPRFGFPPVENPAIRVSTGSSYNVEGFEGSLSGDIQLYARNVYSNKTIRIGPVQ